MNATVANRQTESEWFAGWFDSVHYHELYAHRDDEEAAGFVDQLIGRLQPPGGAQVLDLGCGSGRHSRHLASKGFMVTGLDLSAASIEQARRHQVSNLRFVRQDMRQPFGSNTFDCVLNLFTSFGYFTDPAEHVTVVYNIANALKANGVLVLDYLNVPFAERHLRPQEVIERNGVVYRVSRWTDADSICKRIVVDEGSDASPVEHVERVARLRVEDFRFMFTLCDMRIEAMYGDYRLTPFDPRTSERLILAVRKMDGCSRPSYLRDRFLRMRLTVSGDMPRYDASMV